MAKIKLIESLRSIKRTTIRYNGLKSQTITYWLYNSQVDSTTNCCYFPSLRHFQAPSFLGKF